MYLCLKYHTTINKSVLAEQNEVYTGKHVPNKI